MMGGCDQKKSCDEVNGSESIGDRASNEKSIDLALFTTNYSVANLDGVLLEKIDHQVLSQTFLRTL